MDPVLLDRAIHVPARARVAFNSSYRSYLRTRRTFLVDVRRVTTDGLAAEELRVRKALLNRSGRVDCKGIDGRKANNSNFVYRLIRDAKAPKSSCP